MQPMNTREQLVQLLRIHGSITTAWHCRHSGPHPLFCQDKQAWLAEVLKVSVEPVQSRSSGARSCAFRIHQEAAQAVLAG
jgi:hypothetical protein